jgi:superfamily II DNA or RNA helicase
MKSHGFIRISKVNNRKFPNQRQSSTQNIKSSKVSRARKPDNMGLTEWQIALRKEFGRQQAFRIKNIGKEEIFSEYFITNPQSGGEYRVAIRGEKAGDNFCSCRDFAINTIGTCKHIEFTLAKIERTQQGKRALSAGFSPSYSEIYLRYGAQREVIFKPGTDCPKELRDFASGYFDRNDVLMVASFEHFEKFVKEANSYPHEIRFYDDAKGFIAQVRDQENLIKRINAAFPKGIDSPVFDKLLKTKLYPYQREGALFAAKAGRALLADDMGLGKTIQALATVEMLVKTLGLERALIVAPTSLKHQWKDEIEKFTNHSAEVVEGPIQIRRAKYELNMLYKITNYDVINRDLAHIHKWAPEMIILDEAQRIKNWKTRTAQSVKKLESKYALVLTGTPLENRLEELHSIVEFIDRFRLGPMFRFLHEHQQVDNVGKVVGYRNLGHIANTLKPILVRRTKKEVLQELPERLEKNYFVPMTKQQMDLHEGNREVVARIVAKWRRYGFLTETDKQKLMCALQNMRMSCNSTYLLDKKTDYGVKTDELMTVLDDIFEEPDAKVVVFSQWLGTHELIQGRFESLKKSHRHVFFHGGVPSIHRKDLIKQFKTDGNCRSFLSTDAGGVGLNLQNASAVINMDLPWNPAVLEQRIGRVHRLGQQRPVRVINFVAQGTIEHGMLSLLNFKQSLFAGVLDKGENDVFLGGTRLKRFMESVDKATGGIPQAMPEHTAQVGNGDEVARESTAEEEQPVMNAPIQQQTINDLLTAGISFFSKLGQTLLNKGSEKDAVSKKEQAIKIETDPATGENNLKIALPKKEILQGIVGLLQKLVEDM